MPEDRVPPLWPLPPSALIAPAWRISLETWWAPPLADLVAVSPLGQRVEVLAPVPDRPTVPGPGSVDTISISRVMDGNTLFRDWYGRTTPAGPRGRGRAPAAGVAEYGDARLRFSSDRAGVVGFALVLGEAWAFDWRISFDLDGNGGGRATETLGITMRRWSRAD